MIFTYCTSGADMIIPRCGDAGKDRHEEIPEKAVFESGKIA